MKTSFIPKDAQEALRLAKCFEKAQTGDFTLWPDGSGIVFVDSWKTVNGTRRYDRYEVNTNTASCSCPDFQKNSRFCKHLLRVEMEIIVQFQTDAEACEMDEDSYSKWEAENSGFCY